MLSLSPSGPPNILLDAPDLRSLYTKTRLRAAEVLGNMRTSVVVPMAPRRPLRPAPVGAPSTTGREGAAMVMMLQQRGSGREKEREKVNVERERRKRAEHRVKELEGLLAGEAAVEGVKEGLKEARGREYHDQDDDDNDDESDDARKKVLRWRKKTVPTADPNADPDDEDTSFEMIEYPER